MTSASSARDVVIGPTNVIVAQEEAADQAEEAEEEETLDPHQEATAAERIPEGEVVEDAMTGGNQTEDVVHHHQIPGPERTTRGETVRPTTRSAEDPKTAAEVLRRSAR